MTFYLKYRPKNLSELDLKDVSLTLRKIADSGNLPHAFLFAGPKGTGKTSAARILAKIINCEKIVKGGEPCDSCNQCMSITKGNNLDVIEMDAASNRGIDDVRNLKESIKLSPTSSKKKIYIIDEAHMLTTEASNALLKTLEEPPEHIIFILATTNPEKLIDTIRSRTTLVSFRKANNAEIKSSLMRVVEGEGIKISDQVLDMISKKANGAFRDAVKMLEQVSIEGEDSLNKTLDGVESFVKNLLDKKRSECLNFLISYSDKGMSLEALLKHVTFEVQSGIVDGNNQLILLAELLIEASSQMKNTPIEELPLILVISKWCHGSEPEMKTPEYHEENDNLNQKTFEKPIMASQIPDSNFDNEEVWRKILATIKPINASIEALLRSSKPINYDGSILTLGVYYKFHKERLEEASHRKVVEEVMTKVLNNNTQVACVLMDTPVIAPLTEERDTDIIRVAEEIFS